MDGQRLADLATVDYKDDLAPGTDQTRWLLQRILTLLSRMAAAGSSDKAAEFRRELGLVTRTIVNPLPGESVDTASRKCVALCQDFFQSASSYRLSNEGAFGEIVDLLRDAVRAMAGEAALDSMVVTSTMRFKEMIEIHDVVQLKKRMVEEVLLLEHSVREHQGRREQMVNRLTEQTQSLEQRLTRTRERLTLTLAESSLDPLTRIANRRYFDVQLAAWMAPQAREHPFAVAMFDVDNFKKINDAGGHQVGDRVLRCIARTLRQMTRDEDVLARYGGEEFVLLLRNCSFDKAVQRCAEILKSVAIQTFEWEDPKRPLRLRVTMSCGMTEFAQGDSVYDLLRRADTALYQAKKLGKNRIEILKPRTTADSAVPYQRI